MPDPPIKISEDEEGQQEPDIVVAIWIPIECTPTGVENLPDKP